MPPSLFRLDAKSELAGLLLRPAAPTASAGRQFKVLLNSRAPAQLSLALGSPPAPGARGFRTR